MREREKRRKATSDSKRPIQHQSIRINKIDPKNENRSENRKQPFVLRPSKHLRYHTTYPHPFPTTMSSSHEVGEIFGNGKGPATALLRSPTVIIVAVGLWGMNVYLFRLFGIDYAHVLTLDLMKEREANSRKDEGDESDKEDNNDTGSTGNDGGMMSLEKRHGHTAGAGNASNQSHQHHNHGQSSTTPNDEVVTSGKLIGFSLCLLLLLHLSSVAWIDVYGGSTIGAIFAFYAAVVIGIAMPLPSTAWIRTACDIVFHRTFELLNPRCFCFRSGVPRAVPFIDVFFADILCSLSKVFFDWGMLWHVSSNILSGIHIICIATYVLDTFSWHGTTRNPCPWN